MSDTSELRRLAAIALHNAPASQALMDWSQLLGHYAVKTADEIERLREYAAGQLCECYNEYGKRLSGPCERCRLVYGCESWEEFETIADDLKEREGEG